MPAIIDLKGQTFGRLTAKEYVGKNKLNRAMWLCECECGNTKICCSYDLRRGHTKSCGCLHKESGAFRTKTHGKSKTRLYKIWSGMKRRCFNKNDWGYSRYGGRGITVCEEWKKSYEEFEKWALSHGYEETLTIDRIDVNGNYEPSNCRWASAKEQTENRRTNILVKYQGKEMPLKRACEKANISYLAVYTYARNHHIDIRDEFYRRIRSVY